MTSVCEADRIFLVNGASEAVTLKPGMLAAGVGTGNFSLSKDGVETGEAPVNSFSWTHKSLRVSPPAYCVSYLAFYHYLQDITYNTWIHTW